MPPPLSCGGGLGAAAALASPGETVFFEAPRDLITVTPAARQATIAKLQSLGVHALRIVLYWGAVAPHPNAKKAPRFNQASPKKYNWAAYDSLIDTVTALHWTVLLTITGGPAPRWATAGARDQFTNPSAKDFGLFAQAVGRHYGKLVKLYSIWNEPNQPQYLRPQYLHGRLHSAGLYRSLFLAAYAGLKASGNFAGMKVLMGETSPVGVQSAGIPAPLAFLRGVLCLDSSYRPVGHCAPLPAVRLRAAPVLDERRARSGRARRSAAPTTSRSAPSAISSRPSTVPPRRARSAATCRST